MSIVWVSCDGWVSCEAMSSLRLGSSSRDILLNDVLLGASTRGISAGDLGRVNLDCEYCRVNYCVDVALKPVK